MSDRNLVFVTRGTDAEGCTCVLEVHQPGANDRRNFKLVYGFARESARIMCAQYANVTVAVEAHLVHS